jgi:hypothetical protein
VSFQTDDIFEASSVTCINQLAHPTISSMRMIITNSSVRPMTTTGQEKVGAVRPPAPGQGSCGCLPIGDINAVLLRLFSKMRTTVDDAYLALQANSDNSVLSSIVHAGPVPISGQLSIFALWVLHRGFSISRRRSPGRRRCCFAHHAIFVQGVKFAFLGAAISMLAMDEPNSSDWCSRGHIGIALQ